MATDLMRMRMEKKLFLLYSLNVIDWLCTLALLLSGRFYEANPLARTFIGSIPAGFGIKVAAPLVMVVFIRWAIIRLDLRELRIADRFIAFGVTVYLAILFDHVVNFVILALT